MAAAHDRFAAEQEASYRGIEVRLVDRRLDIGGGFLAGFADVSVVRLAHCHVKPGRREHFVAAQARVWNPGMTSAPGMRGGVFAERGAAEFLVLSTWASIADHERYVDERFPRLRQRSDLADITGDVVDLEPAWTVPMGL